MAQLKLGTVIGGNLAWHQGNDGTESGLDADLLDGQHGSYYQPALGFTAANKAGDTFTGNVSIEGTLTARTTTISGQSLTNTPALTITNVGAGTGGILLGVLRIGDAQDQTRLTAFRVANKALGYSHAGNGIAGQGVHRFTGDANSGTSSGALGSIVDILAPSTATNIFQCRQSDGTTVFNVAYTGALTAESLTLTGNLTVNGTTLTVNSTVTTIDDPVITLGGDTAPSVNDAKDRGIEFRWHNGTAAKLGFFGFDDSTGKFTFVPDASNTSEVFSGTKGTLDANIDWADILNKPSFSTGTVTSVDVTVPTGLTVTGGPVTSSGTLAISLASGYAIPTTSSQTNWDTAYTDRLKWDGGSTGLTASTGRVSLGATTVGSNLFTLTNPDAVAFLRVNADNTVSALDASTFRTAIGAGTSSTVGTVTSVALTVPTGLTVSGSPITSSGTLAVTLTAGYAIPTTSSQTNWDTAYTDRLKWDGGSTGLTASTGRSSLGATTVGSNLFTLTNPGAVTFLRVNADNTVSALDAASFKTAIGADGAGASTLDALTDVVISSATTDQILKYNGTNWVNSTATGGGVSTLDALTDVVISSATTGQVLKYNGTNWVNDTDATGGGGGGSAITYTATVSAASWTGSGPFTQTITVTGLATTSTVILDLDLSATSYNDVYSVQQSYGYVYRAVPGTNNITIYATQAAPVSFDIYITVI